MLLFVLAQAAAAVVAPATATSSVTPPNVAAPARGGVTRYDPEFFAAYRPGKCVGDVEPRAGLLA